MSTSAIEERKSELKEREEKKMNESSQFWKRYVEKVESSVENSVDEEEKSEKMDTSIERISPLEIESNSLLDWTFEEQFKQVSFSNAISSACIWTFDCHFFVKRVANASYCFDPM